MPAWFTYTQPLLLVCVAIGIGGLLTLPPPKGRRAAFCALLGLFLLSWPPVDWLLARPLEARYPIRPVELTPEIQAIVVLASDVEAAQIERPYARPDFDTFARCEHAAWLYRRFGPLPVLACEGRTMRGQSVMRELLRRAGVADDMISVEDRSRSTHENARFGAAILRQRRITRIALVVEAQSMLRAASCFRKEGMVVLEAPSELRTLGPWNEELIPSWHAIRRNEITLHETFGLVWYRFHGWL